MRCSKLKTTECCFLRSETAKSKKLKVRVYRATRNDYATVERRATDSEFARLPKRLHNYTASGMQGVFGSKNAKKDGCNNHPFLACMKIIFRDRFPCFLQIFDIWV